MNMTNLEAQMRGSSTSRLSDEIFESLNRLYEAKLTGAAKSQEFPDILIRVGDLCANKVKQGKMTSDVTASIQDLMRSFTGENANNYFSDYHEGLSEAANTFIEGINMALLERERLKKMAEPVRRIKM